MKNLKKQLEQLEDLGEHRENSREFSIHRENLTFNIYRREYYFTQNAIRTHNSYYEERTNTVHPNPQAVRVAS